MDKDKWFYLNKIREYTKDTTYLLCELLDTYKKYGLRDITYEEAKEFYEKLLKECKGK